MDKTTIKEMREKIRITEKNVTRFIKGVVVQNGGTRNQYQTKIKGGVMKRGDSVSYYLDRIYFDVFKYGESEEIGKLIKFYYNEFLELVREKLEEELKIQFGFIPEFSFEFNSYYVQDGCFELNTILEII